MFLTVRLYVSVVGNVSASSSVSPFTVFSHSSSCASAGAEPSTPRQPATIQASFKRVPLLPLEAVGAEASYTSRADLPAAQKPSNHADATHWTGTRAPKRDELAVPAVEAQHLAPSRENSAAGGCA